MNCGSRDQPVRVRSGEASTPPCGGTDLLEEQQRLIIGLRMRPAREVAARNGHSFMERFDREPIPEGGTR